MSEQGIKGSGLSRFLFASGQVVANAVNSYIGLHTFVETHPLACIEEGFDYFSNFVEERFEKFWPQLYDGEYKNYN